MTYVGTPIDTTNQFQSLQGKRFSGDASTTAFTLDIAPSSVFDIEVFVENVRQDPNSAYGISGTTLTFTGAPPSGTNNIYVVHQAKAVGTINPTNDSVTASSIADDAVESEHLNNNIISGQTALAAEPADTDEFLVSDAGVIKRIDYSLIKGQTMTPAFMAIKTPNQSVSANTSTIVTFNSEIFDSDGKYNTSTSKFTPTVAGKYFLFAQLNIQAVHDQATTEFDFKKNGSSVMGRYKHIALNSSSDREPSLHSSIIVDADADDYFQIVTFTDFGSGTTITGDNAGFTYFGGYRITGA
tara:strand:- start:139 stop:1032 length:894 start_codon:yes stop_codon:yes gene_type:complete